MICDRSRVVVEAAAEGKRLFKLRPDAPDTLTTVLLPDGHSSGVHTAEFMVASCEGHHGGVFLGVAEASCTLDGALGCRGSGWGWGKGMPYVTWVQDADDSWIYSKSYPYYKVRQANKVSCRHDLYSLDEKQVIALLEGWGMRSYLNAFTAAKIDGHALETLDEQTMRVELGVRSEYDRTKLATRLRELFNGHYAYRQGDLVRLVLDMDAGELRLTKLKGEEWVQVGEPVRGLRGRTLHFGVTLGCKKDSVEFLELGAAPAAPHAARLRAWYPSLQDWGFAQGRGSGAFGQDEFTVLRHRGFGTLVELPHNGGQCVAFQACDTPVGTGLYHPEMVGAGGDRMNACAWRAPEVVERARSAPLRVWGAQEGIEWKRLGRIGEYRAQKGVCRAGVWQLTREVGRKFDKEDITVQLGHGSEVVNVANSELNLRVTLTSVGFVLQGVGGGVVCLRGGLPTVEVLEETRRARAVDGSNPIKEDVRPRRGAQGAPPCLPTPAVLRDELMGARLMRDVVAVTDGYGDDPLLNYNSAAQRATSAALMRREKVAGRSGLLVMSHKDTEERLASRRHKLRFREEGVERAARELGSAKTGWGVKAGRAKVERLRQALQDDTEQHAAFEEGVRAAAAAMFPYKSTGGSTSLHGPGFKPFGDARAQSSSRARNEDWIRRVGKPGGSAGTLRDSWGQRRWGMGGAWLNLHPPVDRFKPGQG